MSLFQHSFPPCASLTIRGTLSLALVWFGLSTHAQVLIPFTPQPESVHISITLDASGNAVTDVTVDLPNPCTEAWDWGTTVRSGTNFQADAKFFARSHNCIQIIWPVSHRYHLGTLAPGRYQFAFHAGGTLVKIVPFTVPDRDSDGDGMSDLQEQAADTNPASANSVLRIHSVQREASGVRIEWQGGTQATQFLQRRSDIGGTNGLWETVFTNPAPTRITNSFVCPPSTRAVEFFRILAVRP